MFSRRHPAAATTSFSTSPRLFYDRYMTVTRSCLRPIMFLKVLVRSKTMSQTTNLYMYSHSHIYSRFGPTRAFLLAAPPFFILSLMLTLRTPRPTGAALILSVATPTADMAETLFSIASAFFAALVKFSFPLSGQRRLAKGGCCRISLLGWL